jgi:acylphosphatase
MEVPDEICVHVFFSGIVQGVFFRANTRRQAERLGLHGWVRNLPDGRVEAWVEGDRAAIDELIKFCQTAIPVARVDNVDLEEMEATGDYSTFDIER